MQHAKYLLVSVLVIFTLSACTTMQPVKGNSTTEEIVKVLKPGYEVRLVTKSGIEHYTKVTSISDGYVFSNEESFNIEDIEIIEITRPVSPPGVDPLTDVVTVVGGIGFALLLQALILALVVGVAL
mgnify:FL=1